MQNRLTTFLLVLCAFHGVLAQSITNVVTEAVGDKIVVRYDITAGTKGDYQFEVALYSSKDNYNQTLRNVAGNGVGPSVFSGKERVIVWDVLKDEKEFVGEYSFEIRALLKPLLGDTATMAGVNERSVSVTSKDEAFPLISATINDYLNEAKDFKDAFQMLGVKATESRQANAHLVEAIEQYGRAFEKLNKNRLTYEKYVSTFWKNDVESFEFKSLMDYILGDVHNVNILTLNQKINTINDIAGAKIKKPGEKKRELEKDISEEVLRLDKQLQELDRRANRILHTLSQD
ncbi:MAG TPA: hypothetical protein VF141_16780 [Chryseolinea sp.]